MSSWGPWDLVDSERKRIGEFAEAENIVRRKTTSLDRPYQELLARDPYAKQLWMDLPGRICRTAADLVLPEKPTITAVAADETAAGKVQTRVDDLLKRSGNRTLFWRAVYWARAQGLSWLLISDTADKKSTINFRRATNSVARGWEDSSKEKAVLLCSASSAVGGIDVYTEYRPGVISTTRYQGQEQKSSAEIKTGLAGLAIVPVTAPSGGEDDDGLGESAFSGCTELLLEVANRWRQVAGILNRHAEPAMNVPQGFVESNGKIDVARLKVFERGADGTGAEYMSWQSQLSEAYTEIEKLTDTVLLLTETPPALWGRGNGQAESGRALMFRLLSGLGMARRVSSALADGLSSAIVLALQREDVLSGRSPAEYEIKVEMPSTFIADELDTVTYIEGLRRAQAMSTRTAISQGQGLSGPALEEELRAVENEARAAGQGRETPESGLIGL